MKEGTGPTSRSKADMHLVSVVGTLEVLQIKTRILEGEHSHQTLSDSLEMGLGRRVVSELL